MKIEEALRMRIHELSAQKKNIYTLSKAADLGDTTLHSFILKEQSLSLHTIYKVGLALDITLAEFFDRPYFDQIEIESNREKMRG